MHYFEVCAPHKSFYSTSTLKEYQKDLQQIESKADANGDCKLTESEYLRFRERKLLMAACENPDTKDIIPWHMRTSAFIPTNLIINTGMVLAPPTMM